MARKLTKRQQAFLNAYRELGFVHGAVQKAGVSRELHYNALQADLPISEPAPVEVRKPDSGEFVPEATEVGAPGCLVGSSRERLRRGQGLTPAPQQAHAQCLRPDTDHWRRSP